MKKTIIFGLGALLVIAAAIWWYIHSTSSKFNFTSPLLEVTQKPLEKYSFENLRTAQIKSSEIKLEKILAEEESYTSHLFSYQVDGLPAGQAGKKVTGQINIPKAKAPKDGYPTILMIRGFIDPATYKTGDGTRKAAAVFAQNGFITIAPDMLGYGESDPPDSNTITARVIRPYEVLVLLNSLSRLPTTDYRNLGLWAHSNGGQIALSILEITGKDIPTTLWAPVSKPFPYSILYYTDEYEDYGKAIRKVIANFETDYDADKYSIHGYYDWIQAPIQIHQGTADDAIPLEWTNDLVKALKEKDKQVTYYTYPGTDHDMRPAWNNVIQRDIAFFKKHL